jgi:hypothetical protein
MPDRYEKGYGNREDLRKSRSSLLFIGCFKKNIFLSQTQFIQAYSLEMYDRRFIYITIFFISKINNAKQNYSRMRSFLML